MVYAMIMAAGNGTRMAQSLSGQEGATIKKQYLKVFGSRSVLDQTAEVFLRHPLIDRMILVIGEDDAVPDFVEAWEASGSKRSGSRITVVRGGSHRQESVWAGMQEIERHRAEEERSAEDDIVLIHDGVRPFLTPALIKRVLEPLLRIKREQTARQGELRPCVLPVVTIPDTLRKISAREDAERFAYAPVDRDDYVLCQTPQAFFYSDYARVMQKLQGKKEFYGFTDDVSVYQYYGGGLIPVEGERKNRKITTAEDL